MYILPIAYIIGYPAAFASVYAILRHAKRNTDSITESDARDLMPLVSIVTEDGPKTIATIKFMDNQFITGGAYGKTATAVEITTTDGSTFTLHPGDKVKLDKPKQPPPKRRLFAFSSDRLLR